jgi:hypothetical protein
MWRLFLSRNIERQRPRPGTYTHASLYALLVWRIDWEEQSRLAVERSKGGSSALVLLDETIVNPEAPTEDEQAGLLDGGQSAEQGEDEDSRQHC